MKQCFSTLYNITDSGQPCVLVTVAQIAGSAPREPGARMIVTDAEVMGTIGGGNLEFEAIRIARSRLEGAIATRFMELFPLGSMLQQCCGGAVYLHFEVLTDSQADWIASAAEEEQNSRRAVLASRCGAEGAVSSPFLQKPAFRAESSEVDAAENGTVIGKMIFTGTGVTGSLGDNSLDELAVAKAETLFYSDRAAETVLLHPLAETRSTLPDIADVLFFEVISPCDFQIVLFGAGHVGSALVNVLAGSSSCITWVDSRPEQFPGKLPYNVEFRLTDDPVKAVAGLSKEAYCLVMTHSHQLDQDLCEALLRQDDFAFLGLIGSATKHRRFVRRLKEKGISDAQLERLICPIGIPDIKSKEPGAIAVSIAAQLLKIRSVEDANRRG